MRGIRLINELNKTFESDGINFAYHHLSQYGADVYKCEVNDLSIYIFCHTSGYAVDIVKGYNPDVDSNIDLIKKTKSYWFYSKDDYKNGIKQLIYEALSE